MNIEHKDAKAVANLQTDDDTGIVEALVSITGVVDNVKDIIVPGAYEKTLKTRKPKGVWSHDWNTPVSKTLDIKELMPGDPMLPKTQPNGEPWPKEAGALYVKMQFNLKTQRGREAYEDVKFHGEDAEFSIGYTVPKGGATKDHEGIRRIKELNLFEYSPVLFGAASNSRLLTSVKSLFESDEEFLNEVQAVVSVKADAPEGEEAEVDEVGVEDVEVSDDQLDDGDKDLIDELVAGAPAEEPAVEEAPAEEDSAPEAAEEGKSLLVRLAAIEEKLDALLSAKTPEPVAEVAEEGSPEEKQLETADAVDSKSIRDEMDKLIYDSTFDPKLIDAIDNTVIALENAIKSANQAAVQQAANAAIDGVQVALDSNPDEKTEAGLKALAQSIGEAISGASQEEAKPESEEPAKEEEKKQITLSLAEWKSLTNN